MKSTRRLIKRCIPIILLVLFILTIRLYIPNDKPFNAEFQTSYRNKYVVNEVTLNSDQTKGWISSELYNRLRFHLENQNKTKSSNIHKTLAIHNGTVRYLPLDNDYIHLIKDKPSKSYPYSEWKCSYLSTTEHEHSNQYCIVTNIYYKSSTNEYYFHKNPLEPNDKTVRDTFVSSYGKFKFKIVETQAELDYSSILIRPTLVTHPSHANYAHGFLETWGPLFWTLSEFQSNSVDIDPTKIQIYYSSPMFDLFPSNWDNYLQNTDGSVTPKREWEHLIQSMISIYPLICYKSFNETTVLFKYMLFTGVFESRTPIWGHYYSQRSFDFYPFPTISYRRIYLVYAEWILRNFNLTSKFQLTSIQENLQSKQIAENVPICGRSCDVAKSDVPDTFTGEWIVVLNRAGVGRREIKNADQLIAALLKTFPDHSNPYLRVWPKQFNFNDNLYETARMARSIRLIIGVHGAGLSNTIFMRPGSILYEINSYGCRHLSFNFQRWAHIFHLQHSLWVPSIGNNLKHDDICHRESSITLNVKEIIDEIIYLLRNEIEYRDGYLRRAFNIFNQTSIVDQPPKEFGNIL